MVWRLIGIKFNQKASNALWLVDLIYDHEVAHEQVVTVSLKVLVEKFECDQGQEIIQHEKENDHNKDILPGQVKDS